MLNDSLYKSYNYPCLSFSDNSGINFVNIYFIQLHFIKATANKIKELQTCRKFGIFFLTIMLKYVAAPDISELLKLGSSSILFTLKKYYVKVSLVHINEKTTTQI